MSEHLQTSELTESRVNVKLFFRTILANPGRAVVLYPTPSNFELWEAGLWMPNAHKDACPWVPAVPPAPGYLSTRAIRNRTTGLSFIGRWTMAANTPKQTPAHHIAS